MPVAFGTSGLRGPVVDFDRGAIAAHVAAFLEHIGIAKGTRVYLGCDRRASSPAISAEVSAAIRAFGAVPHWCGVLSTPAIALKALDVGVPAIVVTGSHVPEDYNGIKFYKPDGELLKSDEAPIRDRVAKLIASETDASVAAEKLPDADASIAASYVARYLDAFGSQALSGLKLGVFEHSAAGRDLVCEIFAGLGAEIVSFGRSDVFVAVDTEALDPQSVAECASQLAAHGLDAVISTDGDGDRPMLIGGDGRQVNGDVLCALAARALGIATVVTPLTSTSAIELSGWFDTVVRTRIGSPYVVAAMSEQNHAPIAGFEANGGFLLGTPLDLANGRLSPLPTRDAILPLVALLGAARTRGVSIDVLSADLPARVMKADRLKKVPTEISATLLDALQKSATLRARLLPELAEPAEVDLADGVRFVLCDGAIVHFRASGNAPELRIYVETEFAASTERRLSEIARQLAEVVGEYRGRVATPRG